MQLVPMQVLDTLTKPKLTDKYRKKIISDKFAQIKKQYLNFDNLTTKSDNRENELKLTKEIEAMNKMNKETEAVRQETKNLEVKVIKEINNHKRLLIRKLNLQRNITK